MRTFPPRIETAYLQGSDVELVLSGMSGDEVLRVLQCKGPTIFVKTAVGERRNEVRRERDILKWLNGRFGAPQVVDFEEDGEASFLLLSEIPGQPASDFEAAPDENLLPQLARALREIHSTPTQGCPFPRPLATMLADARRRADEGLVYLDDLDDDHAGYTPEQLVDELTSMIPANEDLVFVHGDICLPNIMMRDDKIIGMVDWGKAGVSDRYQDIALLLRIYEQDLTPEI